MNLVMANYQSVFVGFLVSPRIDQGVIWGTDIILDSLATKNRAPIETIPKVNPGDYHEYYY